MDPAEFELFLAATETEMSAQVRQMSAYLQDAQKTLATFKRSRRKVFELHRSTLTPIERASALERLAKQMLQAGATTKKALATLTDAHEKARP